METLEIDFGRHNPGVDPGLHIWGWEIPVYLFLGGLVAGLMVITALSELRSGRPQSPILRMAPFGALVLLSLGMGALFLDLGHKLYVWRFYLAFRPTSPMSWGSWILVLVYPVGILHGLGSISESARASARRRLGSVGRWIADGATFADGVRVPVLWLSVVLGAGLGVYTGLLLGTTPARMLWNSAVLGPLFLVSGLSTGAALLLLFPMDDGERHQLARFDAVAIIAELTVLGLYLVGLSSGGAPQRAAAATLLGGDWTAPFWGLVVLLGLVTPLALETIEQRFGRPFTRLAPVLVLIGGFSLRVVLVAAGQDSSFRLFQ